MLVLVPAVLVSCLLIQRSESQLICPYCNPNYGETRDKTELPADQLISVDIPGLLEACRGYDTPSGNPHPGRGSTDPGLRKQIFRPMVRDHDGHYAVDGSFITGNEQVRALSQPCLSSSSSSNADSFR